MPLGCRENIYDEPMTIFDLLFVIIVLASVATLATVTAIALRGLFRQVVKLLTIYGICLILYLGVIIVVSLASPQRVLAFGENRCFDDWCIAIDEIVRSNSPTKAEYTVSLRVSNRARRVSQRENGLVVYMVDEKGQRYAPAMEASATPFNVLLQPGESIIIPRVFRVSGASGQLVLIVEHEGLTRFPGMFIIGDDSSLFHKPIIVHLP